MPTFIHTWRAIAGSTGFDFVRSLPQGRSEVRIPRQNKVETKNVDVPASGGTFDFDVPLLSFTEKGDSFSKTVVVPAQA